MDDSGRFHKMSVIEQKALYQRMMSTYADEYDTCNLPSSNVGKLCFFMSLFMSHDRNTVRLIQQLEENKTQCKELKKKFRALERKQQTPNLDHSTQTPEPMDIRPQRVESGCQTSSVDIIHSEKDSQTDPTASTDHDSQTDPKEFDVPEAMEVNSSPGSVDVRTTADKSNLLVFSSAGAIADSPPTPTEPSFQAVSRKKRRISKPTSTRQCYKCQRFGHIATVCTDEHRCRNCGRSHNTRECHAPPDEKHSCANCKMEHRASSRTCPAFPKAFKKKNAPKTNPVEHLGSRRTKIATCEKSPKSRYGSKSAAPSTHKDLQRNTPENPWQQVLIEVQRSQAAILDCLRKFFLHPKW